MLGNYYGKIMVRCEVQSVSARGAAAQSSTGFTFGIFLTSHTCWTGGRVRASRFESSSPRIMPKPATVGSECLKLQREVRWIASAFTFAAASGLCFRRRLLALFFKRLLRMFESLGLRLLLRLRLIRKAFSSTVLSTNDWLLLNVTWAPSLCPKFYLCFFFGDADYSSEFMRFGGRW